MDTDTLSFNDPPQTGPITVAECRTLIAHFEECYGTLELLPRVCNSFALERAGPKGAPKDLSKEEKRLEQVSPLEERKKDPVAAILGDLFKERERWTFLWD